MLPAVPGRARRSPVGTLTVAALLAAALCGCSATSDSSNQSAAESANPSAEPSATPPVASASPAPVASTPTAQPVTHEFKRGSIRIGAVESAGGLVEMRVRVPRAATFELLTPGSESWPCNTSQNGVTTPPAAGDGASTPQTYDVVCQTGGAPASDLTLVTSMSEGHFSYSLEQDLAP